MNENKGEKMKNKQPFKTKNKGGKDLQRNGINKVKKKNLTNSSDLGSNSFRKNREGKTNDKRKKFKGQNFFQDELRETVTQEAINETGKLYFQNEKNNSLYLNGDDCGNHHENGNSVDKSDITNTSINSESDIVRSKEIRFGKMTIEQTKMREISIKKPDTENELKNNIYFNSEEEEEEEEEENASVEDTNHYDLQNQSKQVDYISYMEELRKKNERKENVKVKIEKNYLDIDENRDATNKDEEEKEKKKNKIYKIFLLYAPLATTSFNYKQYLINADDHLEMFVKKKKHLEELWTNENDPRRRSELTGKINKLKNNLENCRSDIVFFTLLSLRDGILNKKKKLQIYIHTINNLLIYVSPEFRVPRNFSLFKKVMTTLLTRTSVYDNEGNVLLQILKDPISNYTRDSICVAVSNSGFPTDAKKFSDKVKESSKNYCFFFSLSKLYDVTHITQTETSQYTSKSDKKHGQQFLCSDRICTSFCRFHYYIRISDLQLSPVIACSKLLHFLI